MRALGKAEDEHVGARRNECVRGHNESGSQKSRIVT